MSLEEQEQHRQRRQRKQQRRKRRKSRREMSPTEQEQARQQKLEREQKCRELQGEAVQRGHVVVFPFLDWCEMRGISKATGRRLAAAGRVKLTYLSERRIGVRSDHDQEYLDSCVRDFA
jgi:hypothetical protein